MVKHVEPLFLYKKLIKSISYTILGATACLGFCLFTNTGSIATLNLINDFTPYTIEFEEFSGYLAGNFQLTHLSLDINQYQIKTNKLSLSWQPLKILNKKLHITDFKTTELQLKTNTSASEDDIDSSVSNTITDATPPKDIKLIQHDINQWLPVEVIVDNAEIFEATLNINEQKQEIKIFKISQFRSSKIIRTSLIDYEGHYGFLHAQHDKKLNIHWDFVLPEKLAHIYALSEVKSNGDISILIDDVDDDQDQVKAVLQAKSFKHNQYNFKDMSINLSGSLIQHSIAIKGTSNNTPVDLKINGLLEKNSWLANITHAKIDDPRLKAHTKNTGAIRISYQDNWYLHSDLKLLGQKVYGDLTINHNAPFNLKGQFTIEVNQLESLKAFIPGLAKAQGKAKGLVHIRGTMAAPKLTGNATIKTLSYPVPQYGVTAIFNDIHLNKQSDKITIDGRGSMSHGGNFSVQGSAQMTPQPNLILKLQGHDLIVSNTPEYFIKASPNLTLSYQDNIPKLEGNIFVPEAQINRHKHIKKAIRTNDVVIVSKNKPQINPKKNFRSIYQDLNIVLGDKIFYKDQGLSSQITGQLNLQQKPDNIPTLKGKLNLINGKYKFQGRVFELTHGQLHFSGGPMNKPLIEVEAKQKIMPLIATKKSTLPSEPIEVGVKLSGEIGQPTVQFFSSPTMPEADIMSYLILGQPQSEASGAQAELLFQAVSQLSNMFGNGKKGGGIFDLAERLKLDHFGLSKGNSNSLEDTILTVGKQLSDRLYLNYSLGFLDTSNTFGLQYVLGKNVSVEAQTGTTGSSADLVVSFDTG
tara:strand:+ start:13566 stop:15989 length:2424 start_codon:yes stop_codon:yes gene_type:complete